MSPPCLSRPPPAIPAPESTPTCLQSRDSPPGAHPLPPPSGHLVPCPPPPCISTCQPPGQSLAAGSKCIPRPRQCHDVRPRRDGQLTAHEGGGGGKKDVAGWAGCEEEGEAGQGGGLVDRGIGRARRPFIPWDTARGRSNIYPACSSSSNSSPAAPPFLAASVPPTYCMRPCSCTSAGAIRAPGRNGAAEASARVSTARYSSVPLSGTGVVVVEDDDGGGLP